MGSLYELKLQDPNTYDLVFSRLVRINTPIGLQDSAAAVLRHATRVPSMAELWSARRVLSDEIVRAIAANPDVEANDVVFRLLKQYNVLLSLTDNRRSFDT